MNLKSGDALGIVVAWKFDKEMNFLGYKVISIDVKKDKNLKES